MLDLTSNARDLNPVADGNRPLRQNHQAADEIAGNILQPETDPDADCTGENSQCAEMDSGVIEDNKNADHQHDIADDLGNGVLERAIQPAVGEEAVEEK